MENMEMGKGPGFQQGRGLRRVRAANDRRKRRTPRGSTWQRRILHQVESQRMKEINEKIKEMEEPSRGSIGRGWFWELLK